MNIQLLIKKKKKKEKKIWTASYTYFVYASQDEICFHLAVKDKNAPKCRVPNDIKSLNYKQDARKSLVECQWYKSGRKLDSKHNYISVTLENQQCLNRKDNKQNENQLYLDFKHKMVKKLTIKKTRTLFQI